MKLPLLTSQHSRAGDRLFHVLQFDGVDAIGVYDDSPFVDRVVISSLTVLSGDEYAAWKLSRSPAEACSTADLLLLRIRNLIAAREANTAEANRELQSGDGWLRDHAQEDRVLAAEIDKLIEQASKEPM
jgi:hypothetical protein